MNILFLNDPFQFHGIVEDLIGKQVVTVQQAEQFDDAVNTALHTVPSNWVHLEETLMHLPINQNKN